MILIRNHGYLSVAKLSFFIWRDESDFKSKVFEESKAYR